MKPVMLLVLAAIIGASAGGLVAAAFLTLQNTPQERIQQFYLTENDVHVSPHSLRGKMDKGATDFILVDLRSQEEYEEKHIVGAINIPAYKDKDTSAYGDVERIVNAFKSLPSGKSIIVYCYSTPCMTGRKIGKMLAEQGIYVMHLGIGWNEWRYDWTAWNHEHEWALTNATDYIRTGAQPGALNATNHTAACPINNEFGC